MQTRILICTDLDRTLLPNGSQPESPGARDIFRRLVARPEVTLAYVSGRHRELVEEAMLEYDLPLPDWIIGDVGTTIYRAGSTEWQHWTAWEDNINSDWRGLMAKDLRPLFDDLPDLRVQEQAKQNRFKLSYYLSMQCDTEALRQEMASRLEAQNLAASLIYSVDEASATGLLDVLPARATKLHAVEFLMRHQGFDIGDTVFAGDSGNDLPVIVSRIPSVLVANADRAVVKQAQILIEQNSNQVAFYLARGGFLGMNGNYSAGILEGIAHYLPKTRYWMMETHED
ncbi:HAD-IIB family hydrolase [Methylomonas sp. OY6]|uniref:HAD-IIB family hydrolase n=1 Tax=Methylomonas defluvii TaxID=3045149 RepID=A0ABU4UDW8_9GAMM|nr:MULTISPECIES: HAD-IIB family hydrolase [unclassified Methylomonas]MDX8127333.1 HAD-IIB family hydrolase [Methylomonas sp. OY6]PKD40986.1 haloacid dehalogenase [Methylomonas sp. Kb3]